VSGKRLGREAVVKLRPAVEATGALTARCLSLVVIVCATGSSFAGVFRDIPVTNVSGSAQPSFDEHRRAAAHVLASYTRSAQGIVGMRIGRAV
jgi:hypothetical protein